MASQFGAETTTDELLDGVDLTGKRILVTGTSAGLGVETARVLAAHGATVVGTARDLNKAHGAIAKAQAETHSAGKIDLIEMDLASLKSVRAAADRLVAEGKPFDVVIANAGVMATPKGMTTDGFETQFGTNHLGHFVFINRIASLLKSGSRVVMLSSSGHRYSDVNLDDPGFDRTDYAPFVAYGRSKTANVLFGVEFDRRHKAAGIRATAVHPGGIHTELSRHMEPGALEAMVERLRKSQPAGTPDFKFKSIPQGAATSIWAGIVAPADEVGGRFCEDCHVAELLTGPPSDLTDIRSGVRPYALDPANAGALWAKSEEMVGEKFD